MRLRNVRGSRETIAADECVLHDPEEQRAQKGRWHELFGNGLFVDHMSCLRCQRTMQTDIITLFQQFFKGNVLKIILIGSRCPYISKYFHAKGLCHLDHFTSNVSGSHNTQDLAIDFHMTDLHTFRKIASVPPYQHCLLDLHGGTEIQNHHNRCMCHTFCAVSRNIAYRNTSGPCSFNIDIVVSCSGLTDQLNRIRKTGNCIAVNGHLLRHNNIHPLHTFKNLILLCRSIFLDLR